MPCAARLLALVLVGTAHSYATAAPPPHQDVETLATRLLGASDAERQQLLDAAEFASVEVARALLDIGQKAMLDAAFPRAALAFRTAETVARRVGAEPEVGRALNGAAFALLRHAQFEPAREAAEASIALHERLGDAAGQAEAWNVIGSVRRSRTADESVMDAYQKALTLWTAAGDRRGMARALGNIGGVHQARGNLDEALGHQEQALQIFEEISDVRLAANTLENIGLVYLFRGEHVQALEYAQRSLALSEKAGDRWGISRRTGSLGNAYHRLGDYTRALDSFDRSLKLAEEVGDRQRILETWNNIGLVHFSMGDSERAIAAYKEALRLNADIGNTVLEATAHNNLGDAAWSLDQRARAEANYRVGLRLAEQHGYKNLAAEALRGLSHVALANGRPREARERLQQAFTLREALKDQDGLVAASNSLARLELAQRRPREALDHARRAAEIAERYEQPELLWEAHTLAGIAHRRLGERESARRSLDRAVEVVEGLRLQAVGRDEGRQRFFESRLSPYHELMALALAGGSAPEALELAERSKARVLADLVRRGRTDIKGTMSDDERREEDRRRAAVVSLNRAIQRERVKEQPVADHLTSLEAERRTRRAEYETFLASTEARHPELALGRGGASPFRLAETVEILPDDSVAALEYAVTDEGSYLFVLTRQKGVARLDSYALGVGRRGLAGRARRLRDRLVGRNLTFDEEARSLHHLLLGPALPRLVGKAHLVIVPDGPLWDVPFQALQDPAGRYVIESAAISYAPSLTVLREGMRKPERGGPPRVLAMGKADFGASSAPPALRLMSDLGPLPDAERQVQAIGALHGPERSTVYLGAQAREDRFKAEAPRHSVVHLATHGVLDETSPLYSHVVLSPGPSGSKEDGLLEAWEMMDLRLDADLVVLSACETGRGRIAPGEGIVGTMWALFVAGSRALLVSQWKVEASSTTELMTAFHRGVASGKGSKASHLREASREVLRRPRHAHPFYWAGFVLVGNPY